MKKLILILTFLIIASCNTLKQDSRKLSKIDYRHPELVAQICDKNFKSVDSVRETIKYIPGETIIRYNTVRLNIDSLIRTLSLRVDSIKDTFFMDIVCPPSEKRIDTIYADKFMTSTHKANTYLLELDRDNLQLTNLKKDDIIMTLNQKIKSKNTKMAILSSILGLLVIGFIIKIIKKFV